MGLCVNDVGCGWEWVGVWGLCVHVSTGVCMCLVEAVCGSVCVCMFEVVCMEFGCVCVVVSCYCRVC